MIILRPIHRKTKWQVSSHQSWGSHGSVVQGSFLLQNDTAAGSWHFKDTPFLQKIIKFFAMWHHNSTKNTVLKLQVSCVNTDLYTGCIMCSWSSTGVAHTFSPCNVILIRLRYIHSNSPYNQKEVAKWVNEYLARSLQLSSQFLRMKLAIRKHPSWFISGTYAMKIWCCFLSLPLV